MDFVNDLRSAVRGRADSSDLAGEFPDKYVDAVVPLLLSAFVKDPASQGWHDLERRVYELEEQFSLGPADRQAAEDRLMRHLASMVLYQHQGAWVQALRLEPPVEIRTPGS